MKIAYINFLNHCYVDTEVEMKEIYTSNHMWKLFENFLVDICRVSQDLFLRRLVKIWEILPVLTLTLKSDLGHICLHCEWGLWSAKETIQTGSWVQLFWLMPFSCPSFSQVCNNTSDRKHADTTLERYVTETVMSIVTCFFSSPFSDQSTSLQVVLSSVSIYIIQAGL